MEKRLPIDRLPTKRPPFPVESQAKEDERLSDEQIEELKRQFAVRFNELFRGLRPADIARQCKITQSVVTNYIEGKRFPSAEILFEIQRATGVNLHWLLTGTGSRRIEKGNIFTEEEEKEILRLAEANKWSFGEQVRKLALGAVEFLKNVNRS